MSTEQYNANAYGEELARIRRHQHEATAARSTVLQALAALGIAPEQAGQPDDEVVGDPMILVAFPTSCLRRVGSRCSKSPRPTVGAEA